MKLMRLLDILTGTAVISFAAAPAMAGIVVPAPEAGIGIASMALLGGGYLYLRRRLGRR